MRVKTCLLFSAVAFMLGAFCLWAVSERIYTRRIDKLSDEVSRGQAINRELQDTNARLTESNRLAIERASGLETELDNIRGKLDNAEGESRKISAGLGSVAAGLGESGSDLQGIIDGLGKVKELVSSLP